MALVGAFAARVLLGDFTVTLPDFVRILGGEQIPGATYIVMESKLPRAVLGRPRRRWPSGSAARSSRPRCATRSPAPTSSASASARAPPPCSRSSPRPARTRWPCRRRRDRRCRSPSRSLVRAVAGDHGGFRLVLAGIGLARRDAVGHPVPLHARRRVGRPAGAALADRQRQRRRLADHRAARRSLLAVLLPATCVWLARSLRVAELGDDTAAGLGVAPRPHRPAAARSASLLVAVGVAAAGPGRVRRLPVRPDRPRPQRRPYDAARRRRSSAR